MSLTVLPHDNGTFIVAEVVFHAGRTLMWIAGSLASLRRWMNQEVQRIEQGISEPVIPCLIVPL